MAVIAIVWCGLALAGAAGLWRYKTTPGHAATAPPTWPAGSIARDANRPTLVVFVHPQCGCSVSTIEELTKLMTALRERLVVDVVVFRPTGAPEDWERTAVVSNAAAVPGIRVLTDLDAEEATRFGVFVSGQALLYDVTGRMVFHGGLTYARGHAGDNAGITAVREWVTTGHSDTAETPVFGCYLRAVPDLAS